MKILACQISVPETLTASAVQAHVHRVGNLVEKEFAANPDFDLVVLPELSTVSYSTATFEQLDHLAEDLRGYCNEYFTALSSKLNCGISYGFPRLADDSYRISQAFVSPEYSEPHYYDKIHVAEIGDSAEKKFFSRGTKLCLFEVGGVRAATIICYDFRFSRLLNLIVEQHNVDIILHPVAFVNDATFHSWHHFAISRAMEHQCYFLSLNRAGADWGNSIFCPPWVDESCPVSTMGTTEEFRIFDVCTETIRNVRETYPLKKDVLSDYQSLL